MNWNELKVFCNSLDENQLQNKVILWREGYAISNINAQNIEEDLYFESDDEDGCYPESEASKPIEELTKVYDKGDPILYEEF